jgi:hypothetical protein
MERKSCHHINYSGKRTRYDCDRPIADPPYEFPLDALCHEHAQASLSAWRAADERRNRLNIPRDDRREFGMSQANLQEVPDARKALWRYLLAAGYQHPENMYNWQTTK